MPPTSKADADRNRRHIVARRVAYSYAAFRNNKLVLKLAALKQKLENARQGQLNQADVDFMHRLGQELQAAFNDGGFDQWVETNFLPATRGDEFTGRLGFVAAARAAMDELVGIFTTVSTTEKLNGIMLWRAFARMGVVGNTDQLVREVRNGYADWIMEGQEEERRIEFERARQAAITPAAEAAPTEPSSPPIVQRGKQRAVEEEGQMLRVDGGAEPVDSNPANPSGNQQALVAVQEASPPRVRKIPGGSAPSGGASTGPEDVPMVDAAANESALVVQQPVSTNTASSAALPAPTGTTPIGSRDPTPVPSPSAQARREYLESMGYRVEEVGGFNMTQQAVIPKPAARALAHAVVLYLGRKKQSKQPRAGTFAAAVAAPPADPNAVVPGSLAVLTGEVTGNPDVPEANMADAGDVVDPDALSHDANMTQSDHVRQQMRAAGEATLGDVLKKKKADQQHRDLMVQLERNMTVAVGPMRRSIQQTMNATAAAAELAAHADALLQQAAFERHMNEFNENQELANRIRRFIVRTIRRIPGRATFWSLINLLKESPTLDAMARKLVAAALGYAFPSVVENVQWLLQKSSASEAAAEGAAARTEPKRVLGGGKGKKGGKKVKFSAQPGEAQEGVSESKGGDESAPDVEETTRPPVTDLTDTMFPPIQLGRVLPTFAGEVYHGPATPTATEIADLRTLTATVQGFNALPGADYWTYDPLQGQQPGRVVAAGAPGDPDDPGDDDDDDEGGGDQPPAQPPAGGGGQPPAGGDGQPPAGGGGQPPAGAPEVQVGAQNLGGDGPMYLAAGVVGGITALSGLNAALQAITSNSTANATNTEQPPQRKQRSARITPQGYDKTVQGAEFYPYTSAGEAGDYVILDALSPQGPFVPYYTGGGGGGGGTSKRDPTGGAPVEAPDEEVTGESTLGAKLSEKEGVLDVEGEQDETLKTETEELTRERKMQLMNEWTTRSGRGDQHLGTRAHPYAAAMPTSGLTNTTMKRVAQAAAVPGDQLQQILQEGDSGAATEPPATMDTAPSKLMMLMFPVRPSTDAFIYKPLFPQAVDKYFDAAAYENIKSHYVVWNGHVYLTLAAAAQLDRMGKKRVQSVVKELSHKLDPFIGKPKTSPDDDIFMSSSEQLAWAYFELQVLADAIARYEHSTAGGYMNSAGILGPGLRESVRAAVQDLETEATSGSARNYAGGWEEQPATEGDKTQAEAKGDQSAGGYLSGALRRIKRMMGLSPAPTVANDVGGGAAGMALLPVGDTARAAVAAGRRAGGHASGRDASDIPDQDVFGKGFSGKAKRVRAKGGSVDVKMDAVLFKKNSVVPASKRLRLY